MKVSPILRGGLGNNLFQICAAIGYSLKHEINYCIPTQVQNPHYSNQKIFFSPNLYYCKGGVVTAQVYKEPCFEYREIPAPFTQHTVLDGYFQSYRYFNDYRDEIIKILDIPYEFKKDWCSIHVRRGDYLQWQHVHPVMPREYFDDAQLYMTDKGVFNFIIISDDIEWCKVHLTQFDDCNYVFSSESESDVSDLSLASSCEHNIGSNSSYSFWIYWLNQNKNKIGVFPAKDKWFGKEVGHNVEDLYMPEWILI